MALARRQLAAFAVAVGAVAAGAVGAALAGEAKYSSDIVLPLSSPNQAGTAADHPRETAPVAGPDGEPILCADGEPLLVDPTRDDPPPAIIESRAVRDGSATETVQGAVPRCGPRGGGTDAHPVWIPDSLSERYPREAPPEFVRMQGRDSVR